MNDMERFDNILSQAVSGYINNWLSGDEFREDEFKTTKSFEKKMSKMIKSQHNVYHKLTLTRARKALCAAAIIIALLLSSLSVGAVRDFVANFFVEHFNTHDSISANTEEGTYPTKLEKIYELGYIPEGYKLADKSVIDTSSTYMYINKDKYIVFEQSVKSHFNSNVDNEFSTQTTEVYKGKEYYVSDHNDGSYTLIWDGGEYIFDITAYLPKETLFDLCSSLKVKEK